MARKGLLTAHDLYRVILDPWRHRKREPEEDLPRSPFGAFETPVTASENVLGRLLRS